MIEKIGISQERFNDLMDRIEIIPELSLAHLYGSGGRFRFEVPQPFLLAVPTLDDFKPRGVREFVQEELYIPSVDFYMKYWVEV